MENRLYDVPSIRKHLESTFQTQPIPALAKGAVLPANRPFLAILGDQTQGTNVESPLEVIQQAVSQAMADSVMPEINVHFAGDLAQLGRVLKPVIDAEDRRIGSSLTKEV